MWTSDEGAEEPLRGSRGGEAPITLAPPHLLTSTPPPTLVLGLGNPILGDDGVGWRVVEAAQEAWQRRDGRRTNDERRTNFVIRHSSHRDASRPSSVGRIRLRLPRRSGLDGAADRLRSGDPGGCDPDARRRARRDLPADVGRSAHAPRRCDTRCVSEGRAGGGAAVGGKTAAGNRHHRDRSDQPVGFQRNPLASGRRQRAARGGEGVG